MNAALLPPLVRLGAATLVFTVLACLLLAARRPLRVRLGAEAAYALWLAVPLGVALCGWPAHRVVVVVPALQAGPASAALPGALPVQAPFDWSAPLALAWAAGALACAGLSVLRQRALWRTLGPLRRHGADTWTSTRRDHGPLLAGLPRPRIVLPADFAERYTAAEQAAVLAHERTHRRRGDLWWNALALGLQCVFWFHPLAARARRACLFDQELACDSAVLRSGGHAPRTYANALLKAQHDAGPALACAMRAASPLKERILNLQRGVASPRMRLAACLLLAGLGAAGARLAWAASLDVVQAAPAPTRPDGSHTALRVRIDVRVDGAAPRHEDRVVAGRLHLDGLDDPRHGAGHGCAADLAPRLNRDGIVDLRMQLTCDGAIVAAPRVLTPLGQPATIAVDTGAPTPGAAPDTQGLRLTVRFDPA